MSTIERPDRRLLPPLVAGETLDRATFHERYEAMPEGTWAELIGGVVHIPSPRSYGHGETDLWLAYWIARYRGFTRGLGGAVNATTILGDDSEVQPDGQLWIPAECGGQSRIIEGYVTGAPELVAEVSGSSRKVDLGPKKDDYERAGVREYIVASLGPEELFWFVRRDARLVRLEPGADGWYRSEVFPGLWLDPKALFAGDRATLDAVLDQGVATPEHAAFAARLAPAARPRK